VSANNWSPSLRCLDWTRLKEDLTLLEQAGCRELHADICDGRFAGRFGLGDDSLRTVKNICTLPIHAHLMIERPEQHIQRMVDLGCKAITIHIETSNHAHRAIHQVKEAGLNVGVALNPGTPLTKVEYLLPYVDAVHLMLVEPFSGDQRVRPSSLERVKLIRSHLDYQESRADLVVEGALDIHTAATALAYGATTLILDDSNIFHETPVDLLRQLEEYSIAVQAKRETV
jgi:ribulose-phosphate 3-epimerase